MTTTFTETPQSIDADLVARSLAGNREAFAQIVARHQSVVCAVTYAACGDLHQSEDLAQETFVAAWKSLGALKDPEHLRAWLRGIARNIVASAMRRQSRAPVMNAQPDDDRLQSDSPGPVD